MNEKDKIKNNTNNLTPHEKEILEKLEDLEKKLKDFKKRHGDEYKELKPKPIDRKR